MPRLLRSHLSALLLSLTFASCAASHGTTWEEDSRDGIKTGNRTFIPAPTSAPPRFEARREVAARTIDHALDHFIVERARVNARTSTSAKGWSAETEGLWFGLLADLEEPIGFLPLGYLAQRSLIRARVITETEYDRDVVRRGAISLSLEEAIHRLHAQIDLQMQTRLARANRRPGAVQPVFLWPVSPVIVTSHSDPGGIRCSAGILSGSTPESTLAEASAISSTPPIPGGWSKAAGSGATVALSKSAT